MSGSATPLRPGGDPPWRAAFVERVREAGRLVVACERLRERLATVDGAFVDGPHPETRTSVRVRGTGKSLD